MNLYTVILHYGSEQLTRSLHEQLLEATPRSGTRFWFSTTQALPPMKTSG